MHAMAHRRTADNTTSQGYEDGGTAKKILEDYLDDLKAIRASGAGVAETSYYPALSNLFNAAAKSLKPKVRCVMNLKNLGAGMPDGGLFNGSPSSSSRQGDDALKTGQLPARGSSKRKEPSRPSKR